MRHAFPTRRLRYLADVNPPVPDHVRLAPEAEYRLLPMEAIREFSAPDNGYKRPAKELLSGYSYIEPTDVAYAKVTPCFENGKGLVGADLHEPVFATTEVTVLRPRNGVNQKFLSYVVQSAAFRNPAVSSMTGAGGLKRVSEPYIKDLTLPAPSAWMQQQIADYLDHETAEIDAFISNQQEFSRLLTERELRSLNDVRIAATKTEPLRRFGSIVLGKMIPSGSKKESAGAGELMMPYLRAANVQPCGELVLQGNTKEMPFTTHEASILTLNRGDIVVVEGGAGYGRSAVIDEDLAGWGFQNSINRIRVNKNLANPWFLNYSIRLLLETGELSIITNQATIPHLTAEKLATCPIPFLELSEQNRISENIRLEFELNEALQSEIRTAINLARERRAAIITAAVTGQLDVTARNKPAAEQLEDDIAQGLHREYA